MRHEQQTNSDHPEAVRSAPVPVPTPADRPGEGGNQRHSATDGHSDLPEDVLDDRGTFDDPAVTGDPGTSRRDGEHGPSHHDGDDPDATRPYDVHNDDPDSTRPHDVRAGDDPDETRPFAAGDAGSDRTPEFHEPAPLPTAFGATSVGDAVAASAMASGRPADQRDPRGEENVQPGDGAPGRTDAFDAERADPTAADRLHDRNRWAAADVDAGHHTDDAHADDRHHADDEHADDEHADAGTHRGDAHTGADRDREDAVVAGAAGYGRPEPGMTDPDAATGTTGTGIATPAAVIAAGSATADTSGSGTAGRPVSGAVHDDATALFEPDAAQAFRDRWRDVQLRFVDDPKAAAGQAQSLVEEAIQALAAALAEQKNKLGDWQQTGDDTEQLRIAVRSYRDFLDRVLGR